MLYTSNEEFDLERRVHLTNEIPPYDMYEALNSTLQTKIDENGESVPTIWKHILGTAKVGYNLPYSIKQEDEDGVFEDNSASASVIGKYNIIRDTDNGYGKTPIENGDVFYKAVNGKISPVYGPAIKGNTSEEKIRNGLNTKYHSIDIDGVWLPEFDLLLHENYRYLENLYPDHPDYRYLLTNNEIDDSFNAAGAVVDYKPANKFFDKVAESLNTFSRIKGASMSEDEIEQEAIKIKIRNLRNNAFRRKYYGSKTGFKMLGADIFNNVTVYPMGTYLPIKDVKASDLALEKEIRENISDESKWDEKRDLALKDRNQKIKDAEDERDKAIAEIFEKLFRPLKDEIDRVQEWYISNNESLEKESPEDAKGFTAFISSVLFDISESIHESSGVRYKWSEETNSLIEDENGDYKSQFDIRAVYDKCLEKFNALVEEIYSNEEYIKVKEEAEAKCNEMITKANTDYDNILKGIAEIQSKVDTLKEWNKEHNLSLTPKQFLEYCRKNNRTIDTYSELYYRKFRMIDWNGDKNAYPVPETIENNKTGVVLPFYNSYIFCDTDGIKINDTVERKEHARELTYVNGIEDDKIRTTQENIVDYKTLYTYKRVIDSEGKLNIELSDEDISNLHKYTYKVSKYISPDSEEPRVSSVDINGDNWYSEFISTITKETRDKLLGSIEVVEKDNKLFLNPRDALEQYPDSEFRGERNGSEDIIYPEQINDKIEQSYISIFDVKKGDELPEMSLNNFVNGEIVFEAFEDVAIANATYKKYSPSLDQRYALMFQNELGNDILVYGQPTFNYSDAGLGMFYIKSVSFKITDVPSQKPENFCTLVGTDSENRNYFFGELIEYEDLEGNEKSKERLLVYPTCKVVGMWKASVVNTTETDGTAESYHKTQWSKVSEVAPSIIKDIHLGYLALSPIISKHKLDMDMSEQVQVSIGELTLNLSKDKTYNKYYSLKSPNNNSEYKYKDLDYVPASTLDTRIKEYVCQEENNITITSFTESKIEIECVLNADDKDLKNTLKFENETARKAMKTLSIGDKVFGTGIDSDDNNVFITGISDYSVDISSPVSVTGTFVLSFEVKKNIMPSSIKDEPEYFKKELVSFGTYEKINPFNHGLYGSAGWPYTSQAIIDGVADISMYDDFKDKSFPIVMQKCHSLLNEDKDEDGKYIWNLIPSTIKYMNDVFVDLNVDRVLPIETFDKKKKECLMSVDWVDYFANNNSIISRATDKVNFGVNVTMQTDTTGLTSNEHGREYTDPNIKLKFITMNWDNIQMWPEVNGKQPEWTVPAYAQIGTAGDGYRGLFRSIDEITHPNVWGATNYDDVMPSKTQRVLSAEGGVLRKRGTWGQDQNFIEPTEDSERYYYHVEEPIFEIPLGEYDTQINYGFQKESSIHTLSKVQASFYKETFDTIMKYLPSNNGEIEDKSTALSINPSESLNHNFISSSIQKQQVEQLSEVNPKLGFYSWNWCGDWKPSKKEENGKYVIDFPTVSDAEGVINYYTIWTGSQLSNLNGTSDSFNFESHSIIFKKPGCDWEYRNFVSGGIYGDGLDYSESLTEEENEKNAETYKGWIPNYHMNLNADILTSLTHWTLAVSDMGAYLNLDAVDKVTFEDNTDLMDEYRNLDDLVWTSDDVDHAMDTTCYWFMFTGYRTELQEGLAEKEYSSSYKLSKYFSWTRGSMIGLIRDNEGEYHILNFKNTNQFAATLPLYKTQGQAYQEFDFITKDEDFGLISISSKMNSSIQLPRKFITPGSFKFDFTVDSRFTGEGLKYIVDENGNERIETEEDLLSYKTKDGKSIFLNENGSIEYRHFNISRSNIYYDSENNCFYTFAEEWITYKELGENFVKFTEEQIAKKEFTPYFNPKLEKFCIKFNENKFFKNTLDTSVTYTNKQSLGDGVNEITLTPTVENISSLNFPVDKLSADDRILEVKEILLRSIWNKTLEPTFFSNTATIDGAILGIDENNKVFIGPKTEEEKFNFEVDIRNLNFVDYIYNEETNSYKAVEREFPQNGITFTSSTSPLLSNTKTSFSMFATSEEDEEIIDTEFKLFKNNLILKGRLNLEKPDTIWSNDAKFIAGASLVKSGDVLVDAKSFSPTSEKNEVEIILKNKFGNNLRKTFVPYLFGYNNNEFVAVSNSGEIVYNADVSLDETNEVWVSESSITGIVKELTYQNEAWKIITSDSIYKFDAKTGTSVIENTLGANEKVSFVGETDVIYSNSSLTLDGETFDIDASEGVFGAKDVVIVCGENSIYSINTSTKEKVEVSLADPIKYYDENQNEFSDAPAVHITKCITGNEVIMIGGYLDFEGSKKPFVATSKDGVDFTFAKFGIVDDDGTEIDLSTDTENSMVSNVVYKNEKFVISILRGTSSVHFVTFEPDNEGIIDFNKGNSNPDVSYDDLISDSEDFGTYSLKLEGGKIIYSSYLKVGVYNGFTVSSVSENSIKFNSSLVAGLGVGTIDIVIAIKTESDISNLLEFVNKEDNNLYNSDGSLIVKEISEVFEYGEANLLYSKNELEESSLGYPSVAQDTEFKFYEYDDVNGKKTPKVLKNNSGNSIKLCTIDGSGLIRNDESILNTKSRRYINILAFKNASTPAFKTVKEANENSEYRAGYEELNTLIKAGKSYISQMKLDSPQIIVNVDGLSKRLHKLNKFVLSGDKKIIENSLLWTNEQEFIEYMGKDYDSTRYALKSTYSIDSNLDENIQAEIFEDELTSDKSITHLAYESSDFYDYADSTEKVEITDEEVVTEGTFAIYDNVNKYFVLKKNVFFSADVSVPYAFVAGGKNLSTVSFEDVISSETPVTGVYLPEKGYGGHRENTQLWKTEKPWDIDPNAFEDGYLKNKNDEFIYVVDRLGNAVESENCEAPIFSNGEIIEVDKSYFSSQSKRKVELSNSTESTSLEMEYIPTSKPECYVSSKNLILGNSNFALSMIIFKNGKRVLPENVSFKLFNRDGTSQPIEIDYRDEFINYYGVQPNETHGSSLNPSFVRIYYTYQGIEYTKDVSVSVYSTSRHSQSSILINTIRDFSFFNKEDGKVGVTYLYKNSERDRVPLVIDVYEEFEPLESWRNTDKKYTFTDVKSESNKTSLLFNINNNVDKDADLSISFSNKFGYNTYIEFPNKELGDIRAFYSEVAESSEELKAQTSVSRLVLLSFVSRLNGLKNSTASFKEATINSWVNALIGTGNSEEPFEIDIFGSHYSTQAESEAFRIKSLNELLEFFNEHFGKSDNVLSLKAKEIINVLSTYPVYLSGSFNEKVYGSQGTFAKLAQEFYDSVDNLANFIDTTSDIKSCYFNEEKADVEFVQNSENSQLVDIVFNGDVIKTTKKSVLSTTLTCGYYFVDKDRQDVFITDTNSVKIYIFNSASNDTLILKGIKGKVACRQPKFNTFADLVDGRNGLGFTIDRDDLVIAKTEDYSSPVAKFELIDKENVSSTLSLSEDYDFSKINDGNKHFIKLRVLTQETVETAPSMFENDKSFIEINTNDIIKFPPDRVWYSTLEDNKTSNGYPLPPIEFYNVDGEIEKILRAENNYAYYNKPYVNGNSQPIYECDRDGHFITYASKTDVFEKVGMYNKVGDLHQPRRPLYQTCQEWFKNDFYLKGSESNPFWQTIEVSSFYNNSTKDWEQTAKLYEYVKSSKGMKLASIDDPKDRYVTISRASVYKATNDKIEVESEAPYVDLVDGKIQFAISLAMENHREDMRIVKYGINAYNSFSSKHSYNTENAKVIDKEEREALYSYLTSKYTVNSKENLVSTNDKDSSIVPITEIGLFNKQHQMIAYAHFPAIEYRSDTQHLDFTMFIYNGVMKS